ncbi:MAG: DUF3185 family protein [Verrucomicrobia bacterium]|nr:DUF3185 family protein [Verrucomicrobiota bacterium]MCH8510643.1 DUF3185 family protein [Kiritimatiellia bacterium]
MNNLISTILIAVGAILLVMGLLAMDSFGSDVSRFFTGTPTDKSVWMCIGGVVAILIGLSGTVMRGRKA